MPYRGFMFENLSIPSPLLPRDGRFGSGPSLIRPAQVEALARADRWGTSHRKAPVIELVSSIQSGLAELFSLPEGYEIVLGNGGASAFWSIASVSLIRRRARLAVAGEFAGKFAEDVAAAPWLESSVIRAPFGKLARVDQVDPAFSADLYAYAHNETSTGVVSDIYAAPEGEALTVVDAVSIAGAAPVDLSLLDAYYFSPQKCFGSDGGLWVALLSPAAVERAFELESATDRPQFGVLKLADAVRYSRKHQTVNTPAIGTLLLLDEQITWMLASGGLEAMAEKSRSGAEAIWNWAQSRDFASLFVQNAELRSPTVTTIDLDPTIPAGELSAALRRNGIVDVDGYRGISENQLRVSSFPSVERTDIEALLASIDWLVERV